jgi:hypothetical protein
VRETAAITYIQERKEEGKRRSRKRRGKNRIARQKYQEG